MRPGTQGYAEAAPHLLRTRLAFAEVHAPILHLIPTTPSRVLDIGSGPGHDACALAEMGHEVVAVEPTPDLLKGAIGLYGADRIRWLDDGLPDLTTVRSFGSGFGFILLSGVWMHLDATERGRAMPVVAGLLERGGTLALSLRHGRVPTGRRMFEVGAAETIALAAQSGLATVLNVERESLQAVNRAAGVTWTHLAFSAGDRAS